MENGAPKVLWDPLRYSHVLVLFLSIYFRLIWRCAKPSPAPQLLGERSPALESSQDLFPS